MLLTLDFNSNNNLKVLGNYRIVASSHISREVHWPDNVVPIFQPSHSPELNPIERVWQELRTHFILRNLV